MITTNTIIIFTMITTSQNSHLTPFYNFISQLYRHAVQAMILSSLWRCALWINGTWQTPLNVEMIWLSLITKDSCLGATEVLELVTKSRLQPSWLKQTDKKWQN